MRYLIDGYNLLHATGHLSGAVAPLGLERARRTLLDRIVRRHGPSASCVTVVFDVRRAPPGLPPEEDYQGVRVLYALGREADEVIEELVRRDAAPRQLTVVSNDRRLREAARRRRCRVADCLDFFESLLHPEAAPPPEVPPDGAGKPEAVPGDLAAELERAFRLPGDPEDEAPGPPVTRR
jgi:uncharacterized protein